MKPRTQRAPIPVPSDDVIGAVPDHHWAELRSDFGKVVKGLGLLEFLSHKRELKILGAAVIRFARQHEKPYDAHRPETLIVLREGVKAFTCELQERIAAATRKTDSATRNRILNASLDSLGKKEGFDPRKWRPAAGEGANRDDRLIELASKARLMLAEERGIAEEAATRGISFNAAMLSIAEDVAGLSRSAPPGILFGFL